MWFGAALSSKCQRSEEFHRGLHLLRLVDQRRLSAGNLGFDCATTFMGFDQFSGKATSQADSYTLGRYSRIITLRLPSRRVPRCGGARDGGLSWFRRLE